MRKINKFVRLAIAVISIASLTAPVLAQADSKPVEQFYDQGPSVKNVGGYTGILVEDSARITGSHSKLLGMYYEQKNGAWVTLF